MNSSDDDDSIVVSFQFLQGKESRYSDTDILIDTGSTCSVVMNEKMLLNISDSEKTLRAIQMAGTNIQTRRVTSRAFSRYGITPSRC